MAAWALAAEDWQKIQNHISSNSNGTYNVTLWNGTAWQNFTVSGDLDRGADMAQLGGDIDPDDGALEIWPLIFEKAFAQMVSGGFGTLDEGGVPGNAWTALAGSGSTPTASAGLNQTQLHNIIENGITAGKQVLFTTVENLPEDELLKRWHVYIVVGVSATSISVSDPDDPTRTIVVDDSYLPTFINTISVLDDPL